MALDYEKRVLQTLLASEGWRVLKELMLKDIEDGNKLRICLNSQLQAKMNCEVDAKNYDKAQYYKGQMDLIRIIIKLPENAYKRA